jgi:hypothetical protein
MLTRKTSEILGVLSRAPYHRLQPAFQQRTGVHSGDGRVASLAESHRSMVTVYHQEGDRNRQDRGVVVVEHIAGNEQQPVSAPDKATRITGKSEAGTGR